MEFQIERHALLEGVPHGFFGSAGGKHQFGFGGPGDPAAARALREAAADAILPGGRLAAPHQVHSPDVAVVAQVWDDAAEGRPVADAVVTATPGIVLGIVTADCGPILFADREAGVVGAAHAGWRGAVEGVLENTVAAMEGLGARRENIVAVLGPTIAQPSYEVDAPFRARFTAEDECFFADAGMREGARRWHFDLPGYIIARLAGAGLSKIADLGRDTFSHVARYHSHRRSTQARAAEYGRQISMIALP
ncbi:peptidoglycan editing factor PgeF [Erythrobacter dokdonensis]|uniref:Purine nucleoside phosphorylase n=1 Tax=Erythrobacter dokdonensis DSW-74 TaxID=1300349 RepID=A0A1A7BDJ7_9SPHN|nr:peptidoglycan editing factor PgeF [Erythrobacter dokdonensis]OBV10608.1 Multi-copper polyphenol oxidoreductase, laccase [Erythrobacter dokdonensis DSW-74]